MIKILTGTVEELLWSLYYMEIGWGAGLSCHGYMDGCGGGWGDGRGCAGNDDYLTRLPGLTVYG